MRENKMKDFEFSCKNCDTINNYSPNKGYFICKKCKGKNLVFEKSKEHVKPSSLYVADFIPKNN